MDEFNINLSTCNSESLQHLEHELNDLSFDDSQELDLFEGGF